MIVYNEIQYKTATNGSIKAKFLASLPYKTLYKIIRRNNKAKNFLESSDGNQAGMIKYI